MAQRLGGLISLSALIVLFPLPVSGQKYDHVHLTAPSGPEAVAWYAEHMGCREIGRSEACLIDDVQLTFFEREPTGGTVGTGMDHIGFSFEDLETRMAGWKAAGVTVISDIREIDGLFKLAFVEDPWGTKIEVVEDHEYLGFHHVHLMTPNPEQTLAWYREMFGGESDSLGGMLPAVRYDDVWLLASRLREGELVGTRGRSMDHLGWHYDDLDAAAATMKEKGAEFSLEPRPYTNPLGIDMRISFLMGPDDVFIELVQRPSFTR